MLNVARPSFLNFQKMVELYRQEFFNHSISGRHAYTLARQYREMDFVRMLAPNGNELPSEEQ